MDIAYFDGKFLPKNEIKISPDDRGFLFADGIYEVVRWYKGFFYDMNSHLIRLKRSLNEIRIKWPEADSFPSIAEELIKLNGLLDFQSTVYIQVTRGAAKRTHDFPSPDVNPTVYAIARDLIPDTIANENGIGVILKKDIRWSRCDIKSIALLPNTISFQEAREQGCHECIFVRDGLITEGSHSNIFFVMNDFLYTHPESDYILSGITRKNVLRIARENNIPVQEEAVAEKMIKYIHEAFITNTSAEITPVNALGKFTVGNGQPGPITKLLQEKFNEKILHMKG
jgi:D-alanine transaminase